MNHPRHHIFVSAAGLLAGACAGLSCLASGLSAQASPVTVPKVFRGGFGNTWALAPFGRTKYFGQFWYRGDSVPASMPITQVGFRARRGASYAAAVTRIQIVLDNTSVDSANLSRTFAANLSKTPTTFFKLKNLNLPAVSNNQNPDLATPWIPGDQVMLFRGPHLIVQADVQTSAGPASTGYDVDAFIAARLLLYNTGKSCGASKLDHGYSGNYDLTVTGAPASAPVTFHVGLDNQRSRGANLPVDLGVIGMTNCELYLDPFIAVTVMADAAGRATLSARVPSPAPSIPVFTQAAHPQPSANPANYVSTNLVSAMFGTFGVANWLYNWTSFGPTAQYGPYSSSRGPIVLLK